MSQRRRSSGDDALVGSSSVGRNVEINQNENLAPNTMAEPEISGAQGSGVDLEKTSQDGLRRITCIAYDELNCEILTGNALGQITVWGH